MLGKRESCRIRKVRFYGWATPFSVNRVCISVYHRLLTNNQHRYCRRFSKHPMIFSLWKSLRRKLSSLCGWDPTAKTGQKSLWNVNWAPFVLGIVIVGLEVGWIYAYKAGWQVSTGFIVQSAFLAVLLLFVGFLLYHEALTWNKIVGVFICLIGLAFINFK